MKNNKLIVALDVDDIKEAESLVDGLQSIVSIFKIGSRLFTAYGPEVIKMVNGKGCRVFLDLKYHDIPTVIADSVRMAGRHDVFALTLHTLGGREMLERSVSVESRPLLWGVTVLTSMNNEDLKTMGVNRDVGEEVLSLAGLARSAGMDGVVCSAREIEAIRKEVGGQFMVVTPGIRPAGSAEDEQKRVMTPKQAITKGATYIVVGRPVIKADNPHEAAENILREIE